MTKQECIHFLKQTQRSYNTHMSSIKYSEKQNFSGYKPLILNKEKSLAGKLLYENIKATKNIIGTIFYDELESLHSEWCEEYNKISNVYLKNTKKSFLFGKRIDPMSKDKIKGLYNIFCEMEGFKSNLIRHNKDIAQLWALMEIPEDSHHRVTIREGSRAGRKVDHIRLSDINEHITMKYKENE